MWEQGQSTRPWSHPVLRVVGGLAAVVALVAGRPHGPETQTGEGEETWVLRVGLRLQGEKTTVTPPTVTTLDRCLPREANLPNPSTAGVAIEFAGSVHSAVVQEGWSSEGQPLQLVRFCLGLDEAFERVQVSIDGRSELEWEVGRTLCLTRRARGRVWADGHAGFSGPGTTWGSGLSALFPCRGPDGSKVETGFARGPYSGYAFGVAPPAGLAASCGTTEALWSSQRKSSSGGDVTLFHVSCGFDAASRGPLVIRHDGKEIARYEESDFEWVPSWNWDPPVPDETEGTKGE